MCDPCNPCPCVNGGICQNNGDCTYACSCTEEWTGQNCRTYTGGPRDHVTYNSNGICIII